MLYIYNMAYLSYSKYLKISKSNISSKITTTIYHNKHKCSMLFALNKQKSAKKFLSANINKLVNEIKSYKYIQIYTYICIGMYL